MKPTSFWLIVNLMLSFLAVNLALGQEDSKEPTPLLTSYVDQREVPLEFGLAITDAESEYLIDVDRLALAADPAILALDLYKGVRLEAHRLISRKYTAQGAGGGVVDAWTSWSGNLYFPEVLGLESPAGLVVLNDHGSHITGMIRVDATLEDFQIVGNSDGEHRLIRINPDRRQSCGLQFQERTGVGAAAVPSTEPSAASNFAGPGIESTTLTSGTTIKVLAMLPNSNQTTIDFIEDSVSLANTIFAHSGIAASYDLLIGTFPTPTKNTLFEYLHWMNTSSGRSAIEQFRDSSFYPFHADMVAWFVEPTGEQFCGIANLRYRDGQSDAIYDGTEDGDDGLTWSPDEPAYTVHIVGCGMNDYTFAHELGHNFGLRHDNSDDSNSWWGYERIDDNPRGYELPSVVGWRATVMGCVGNSAPCVRIPYFSDANSFWGAVPLGETGSPHYADAVEALNNHIVEYSLFR
jgi:hypothetical protein